MSDENSIGEEKVSEKTPQDLFWEKATEVLESVREPLVNLLNAKSEKPKMPSMADILNEVSTKLDSVIDRKVIARLVDCGVLEPRALDDYDKAMQKRNPTPRPAYDAASAALGDVQTLGKF